MDMCARLEAYNAEHGNCDVLKKDKADPLLGGWVAAVRRSKRSLSSEQVAQLDTIGFLWTTNRSCGSTWMRSFRALRDFNEEHGHNDVARVYGAEHELSRWCAATLKAQREGSVSPKRAAYLYEVKFGE